MRNQQGQALVETAIIAPILIFLLIGVLEVGWALRGYLVLASANREAARFAVRPGYLVFSKDNPGYEQVISHTFNAISDQIVFTGSTVIISHFFVDAQQVCELQKPCDCETAIIHPYSPTILLSPMNVPTYMFVWPSTSTITTNLDYQSYAMDLIAQNRRLQCQFQKMHPTGELLKPDSVIVVEFFYSQPQLVGFPLISNPLTDPVPMYAHSIFRKIVDRTYK